VKILALNAGSSSVKYELFDLSGPGSLLSGMVERIGEPEAGVRNHEEAFAGIAAELAEAGIRDADVDAIGHRVVHGGDRFSSPVLIDASVMRDIRALLPLAPLHNSSNLAGIEAALLLFPTKPQVAVFDTAFHDTLIPPARYYALPQTLAQENAIRRYGFHGSSYACVLRRAAALLDRPVSETNLVVLHLGNGASACAIENGRSIDTSMGFTPLEGLVMGTRAGDIDAGAVLHLLRETGLSAEEVDGLLNERSGLLGICGDSDMRHICQRVEKGDAHALRALEMFCYRVRKYVGAYFAVLPRVDALVFTAGIGEHRAEVRQRICVGLTQLGVEIDATRNGAMIGSDGFIDTGTGPVRILVVASDEALEIARQSAALVTQAQPDPHALAPSASG
jgi:acetate kinase